MYVMQCDNLNREISRNRLLRFSIRPWSGQQKYPVECIRIPRNCVRCYVAVWPLSRGSVISRHGRYSNRLWEIHTSKNYLRTTTTQIARFTGPTWVLSAPDGPHIGPMNLAIWLLRWHVSQLALFFCTVSNATHCFIYYLNFILI